VLHLLESPVQVVVIAGEQDSSVADELYEAAVQPFAFNKTVLRIPASQAVGENLPPSLAQTIPNLPQLRSGRSLAVLCSGTSCQPPVFETSELTKSLAHSLEKPI
jgi:uncharacterized protein